MKTMPFNKPKGRIFTPSECEKIYDLLVSMDIKPSAGFKITKNTRGTTISLKDKGGPGSGSGSNECTYG